MAVATNASSVDDLDRWVMFCNNTEARDKAWGVLHSGIRIFVNIVPAHLRADVDFLWRYVLDARKTSWLLKWVREIQGFRAALRAPGDQRIARLRAAVRLWFGVRWLFENLHIASKMLPNGKGNVLKLNDPSRLNRLAKFCWLVALLHSFVIDTILMRTAGSGEKPEERKLRRLRFLSYSMDALVCVNLMQVPQEVTRRLLGKEKAFMDTFVGICGATSSLCGCYFAYPERPSPMAVCDSKKD
eukprot:TRINITY_DN28979_c1_g1_i1.p1 TRINITY_DN28979_c1_g1~~TRINITY_DN28979_c1_g1_i1.p1  ORF type:complete len:274 (-),score=39.08 TRINITY_DN28979_c1_g1_i1:154-882(-)